MPPDCVFCKRIKAGEVHLTGQRTVVSFEPLNPVTPGHRLFVPSWHIEWSDSKRGSAAGAALYQAAVYAERNEIDSFNIITSNGAFATQTVPHIHIHLVPRRENDGLHLPWTGQKK